MSLARALEQRKEALCGAQATQPELDWLRTKYPISFPEWLAGCLVGYPVIGVRFSAENGVDLTGRGIELRWMSPSGMIAEAIDAYPGIAIVPMGYVPIGDCMFGSGDPYFLKLNDTEDPPLVRVFHDMIDGQGQVRDGWYEVVCNHVSDLVGGSHIVMPQTHKRLIKGETG